MNEVTKTAYETDTGKIRWYVSGSKTFIATHEVSGMSWIDGYHNPDTHYISNSVPWLRPATGLPESHALPIHTDWYIPDVPEGTDIIIDGEVHAVSDGSDLEMSFSEPGEYVIKLRPPFPWIRAECVLEVTDAD